MCDPFNLNRLEVWASVDDDEEVCLYDCLCQLKGITEDSYREYFVERKDKEAVEHLFYLTSGLKSQIIGEDQILTQVKDALNLARENFAADGVLEVCSEWPLQRKENQDRSSLFPWKPVSNPSGNRIPGPEGVFS